MKYNVRSNDLDGCIPLTLYLFEDNTVKFLAVIRKYCAHSRIQSQKIHNFFIFIHHSNLRALRKLRERSKIIGEYLCINS